MKRNNSSERHDTPRALEDGRLPRQTEAHIESEEPCEARSAQNELPSKTSNSVTILKSLTAMITDKRPPGIAERHRTAAPAGCLAGNKIPQINESRDAYPMPLRTRIGPRRQMTKGDSMEPVIAFTPIPTAGQRAGRVANARTTPQNDSKESTHRLGGEFKHGVSRTEFPQINDHTAHRSAERRVHMGPHGTNVQVTERRRGWSIVCHARHDETHDPRSHGRRQERGELRDRSLKREVPTEYYLPERGGRENP